MWLSHPHNNGADRMVNTHSLGHRVKYKLTSEPLAGDSTYFWHDTRACRRFSCQTDCFPPPARRVHGNTDILLAI